jgi:hypothetical protein
MRDEFPVDEVSGGLLDQPLLVREPEVHKDSLSRSNKAGPLKVRNAEVSDRDEAGEGGRT